MKPIFVKELFRYKLSDIQQIFNCEKELLNSFTNDLIKRKIIEKESSSYKFAYVGFIQFQGKFIFVMPKFIQEHHFDLYYPTIVKLFKEYNERENLNIEEVETFGDFENEEFYNLFKIVHFLLQDYDENGLYNNDKVEQELNGDGEIDWNRSIEQNQSYISGQNIMYLDFYTQKTISDEEDFIRKVHMFVLNQCSSFLKELDILDILGFPEVDYNIDFNELGEEDYILYKIDSEKSNQFLDRKLMLLDALYYFVSKQNSFKGESKPYLFGTRSFEIIWEKVCSFVFNNEYNKLQKFIPSPVWKDYNTLKETKRETLIPDILRKIDVYQLFFVFDAKYYTTTFNENGTLINNAPGISDISKQYLYEKVFYKYLDIKHYSFYNIFLMPTDGTDELFGETRFELFEALGPIFLLRLNAQKIFSMYSKRERYEEVYFKQLSTALIPYKE
ncbi:LlaJI family restriction endonuclease [Ornithinibacillus halophilus]|uniref:LlaJI restriction endonuclease n=1 Tax=Ornithinibacillus halophilus TaxID=930117 RepID=A0A1M5G3Y6_9BACI|nr:LlaJI family restriction endonuclease [Ornithinibacillus halophilus]SHF98152.1 LlaJI restriction endonuclease [Ornithinibacillus halophilus]